MRTLRQHAVEILTSYDSGDSQLKSIRNSYCAKYNISGTDRQRITALTNEVVRWKGRLDFWIRSLLDKPNKKLSPLLKNYIRLGIYLTVMDKAVPAYAAVDTYVELSKVMFNTGVSKLVNAVLRKAVELDAHVKPENCTIFDWNSFPEWLWKKWVRQFGLDKTIQLCDYFNSQPKMHIRRNKSKIDHDQLMVLCNDNQVSLEKWDDSDCFYIVDRNAAKLQPLLQNGKIAVQDRAAGIAVEFLNPQQNETILDVCAAPGTKTNYLAELIKGQGDLFAYDNNKKRMSSFSSNNRFIEWEIKDATRDEYPIADAILIDVPCSGTGVIGKKPDIRWRRNQNEINEFASLQLKILNHMCQFVKTGGRIIYSTCSLEPEENMNVVKAFLKLNTQFQINTDKILNHEKWIQKEGIIFTYPPISKTDGMFSVNLVCKD